MERTLNLRPAVEPEEKLSQKEWFMRFGVSTNVTFKKLGHQDRHVFDVEKFQNAKENKPLLVRIINAITFTF